jgi:integration host factor subunit beta
MIDSVHTQFITAVAGGRRMDKDQVRALADGRIFSGEQAKRAGSSTSSAASRTHRDSRPKRGGIEGEPNVTHARSDASRGGGAVVQLRAGRTVLGPPAFGLQIVYEGRSALKPRREHDHESGTGSGSMTKRDLIDEVVKIYPRFSGRDAEVIVNAVFDSMTEALARGERIEIRGFGSFVVKHRQAPRGPQPEDRRRRAGRAKRVPFFKVGKELKLRVDGKPVPESEREASQTGLTSQGSVPDLR